MKKLFSILLVFLMVFGFAACELSEADKESISSIINSVGEMVEEMNEEAEKYESNRPEFSENIEDKIDDAEEFVDNIGDKIDDTFDSVFGDDDDDVIDEYGSYTSKDDVAEYIHIYGRLPDNFMTKSEARDLGWEGGSLEPFAPGMCIGGDRFGNYEGLLPESDGRTYTECDIDTLGATSRGAKRIVFSNDGLIFYTDDHYDSFEMLYPED